MLLGREADHRAQGSKIMPVDLEHVCRGRTATNIGDLQTYITTGAGGLLDIIRRMRVVIETHCRTTYPDSFLANDWLGYMVRKIREAETPMLRRRSMTSWTRSTAIQASISTARTWPMLRRIRSIRPG